MKCSLCDGQIEPHILPTSEEYWTEGHNAEPLNNGRCCDKCNAHKVIPARIAKLIGLDNDRKPEQAN